MDDILHDLLALINLLQAWIDDFAVARRVAYVHKLLIGVIPANVVHTYVDDYIPIVIFVHDHAPICADESRVIGLGYILDDS